MEDWTHTGDDRAQRRLPGQMLLEPGGDFPNLGMSSELRFLEQRHAVTCHLEPALSGWNQLDPGVGVLVSELSRQTGGSGLVVSKRAVFDRDVHEFPYRGQLRFALIRLWAQASGSPGLAAADYSCVILQ